MNQSAQLKSANTSSKTGAWLTVYALEHLPVKYTFGIPGVHTTELYDELDKSETIRPVLVTHEGGGAFMADAVSRTSDIIGVLVVVPAAGLTHAMSGIGEAFLDGIPMLIISGGVRRDTGRHYQLHDLDLQRLMAPLTKKTYLIQNHQEIVPTIFDAYTLAVRDEQGPVYVEIPADTLLMRGAVADLPAVPPSLPPVPGPDAGAIQAAADLLRQARSPGLFLGWGCRACTPLAVRLAEQLEAPVATTLQGLSVFPADHPLHTGMGFGRAAVPAAENAFAECDCLLAVGTRFSEIPTGSYSIKVPENLIHIDINPAVFNKNYAAKVALHSDAAPALNALLQALQGDSRPESAGEIRARIAEDKQTYLAGWRSHPGSGRVNPALFFEALHKRLDADAVMVADDGHHTFLCAELFPLVQQRLFISPSDFNCMGYCVPAVIGAKLADPRRQVIGIVGDGAFLMTCMEILTAASEGLGVVYFVFHDGELAQISKSQKSLYNRKTCGVLGNISLQGVADAVGARFLLLENDADIGAIIAAALKQSSDRGPVIVDVRIDYSKPTRFTRGVVKAVSSRLPMGEKARFIGRALWRRVRGQISD